MGNELSILKSVIDINEIEKLKESSLAIKAKADSHLIKTDEDYKQAVELTRSVKVANKVVSEYFKPIKDEANKVVKDIRAEEKLLLDPLSLAESALKSKIMEYDKKKQEALRKEQEAIAERKRKEAERILELAMKAEKEGNAIESAILQ